MEKPSSFSWVVAYIDINHLKNVERDLERAKEYKDISAYIPLVKILKKQFKGEEFFDEVPLLFNYGFFKIPIKQAISKGFLDTLKADVSCIYAWVSDPAKVLKRKPILWEGNRNIYTDLHVPIATATSEDIANLVTIARESTIYSAQEIEKLRVGMIITLKGYPWEGMDAKVNTIDHKKKKVSVSLLLFNSMKDIKVSFDSVFFTAYHNKGYDDSLSTHKSLDEMADNKTLDKLTINFTI